MFADLKVATQFVTDHIGVDASKWSLSVTGNSVEFYLHASKVRCPQDLIKAATKNLGVEPRKFDRSVVRLLARKGVTSSIPEYLWNLGNGRYVKILSGVYLITITLLDLEGQ